MAMRDISPLTHFLYVSVCCLPMSWITYIWLIKRVSEWKILTRRRVMSGYSSTSSLSIKYDEYYSRASACDSRDAYSSGDYFITRYDEECSECSRSECGSSEERYGRVMGGPHSSSGLLQSLHTPSPHTTHSHPYSHRNITSSPPIYSDSQTSSIASHTHSHSNPTSTVRFLCILGITCELVNGTVTDWLTVYIKEDLEQSSLASTVAYALFAVSGVVSMFLSDVLVKHYFRHTVVRVCACVSVCGVILIAISGFVEEWFNLDHHSLIPLVIVVSGAVVVGAAISCMIPVVFSAASDIPHTTPSQVVPKVTSLAYLAYLCGPPVFGYIADVCGGVRYAFVILSVVSVVSVVYPGHVPHNRYGLLVLLRSKRDALQSTDFEWQNDSTPTPTLTQTPKVIGVCSEEDNTLVRRATTTSEGVDHYKDETELTHGGDTTLSDSLLASGVVTCGNHDTSDLGDVGVNECVSECVSIDDGEKRHAINKHLSQNKYPVF